jgi:SAM-dependent methyltransferase
MAEHLNLYQQALYYDTIFDRDVEREVDFVTDVYERYAEREGPNSVIDMACGPGYHALAFAKRGVRAVGLDLRPEMLELGAQKAVAAGVVVEWLATDMRSFELSEPVDAAFIMFDGLDALLTDEDLVNHFQAVARNLTPGGIYIVDLTHPRECSIQGYSTFEYKGSRNGAEVKIHWATNSPSFDPITGVAQVELEMHVKDKGKQFVVKDSAFERFMSSAEIRLLAKLSRQMQVVGWHGDHDIDQPFDNSPASRRMIAVLQKKEHSDGE